MNTKTQRELLIRGLTLNTQIEVCEEEMADSKKLFDEETDAKRKELCEYNYNYYGGRRFKAISEYSEVMKRLHDLEQGKEPIGNARIIGDIHIDENGICTPIK